mmetsp:Transcript_93827/g.214611  ORF Transcript_93827/g.214611 Transcript_93827/m.214611 type:complete len:84 (+) Transcript_93827:1011-1262(+)
MGRTVADTGDLIVVQVEAHATVLLSQQQSEVMVWPRRRVCSGCVLRATQSLAWPAQAGLPALGHGTKARGLPVFSVRSRSRWC